MDGSHAQVTLYKPDGSNRDISMVPPGLKKLKAGGNGCVWNPKWASDARHMAVAGPIGGILSPDHADTYAKAGAYTVTATQGDHNLKGTVRVTGRSAPKLLSATAIDDRHVLLAFCLDGKKVKEIDPSPASFIENNAPPLAFASWGWLGKFEYVAAYNRFIEEPEAAQNAAAVAAQLAQRKPLPRIEVQARLVTKSKLPEPGQMAPYRNALVVNEYEVENVLSGTYAGKTIRVAQWGMLDLRPTPLATQEPGTSVKLVLERFPDHDELVPEPISDTLEENFDLTLYTDVNL